MRAEPQALPSSLRLLRLTLTDFRSYAELTWAPRSRISVLTGPNGSGKTNLLEAVSLLAPGRGLRGARGGELARHGAGSGGWAVAARLAGPSGRLEIGTGTLPGGGERRVFRLDGAAPRSLAEIASRIAVLWLTPQMDRLFQDSASGRRRFLDRLVFALEPSHAREVASFEAAMAERNRLLATGRRDAAWLGALEDAMARHAVAITAARVDLAGRLSAALASGAAGRFPPARIGLACPIAGQLAALGPALAVEDWLRAGLAAARARDEAAGGAALGAHRADLVLADAATGTPAALASTGERKALLVGLILGLAVLIETARGFPPLLLLDEPAVHLDAARRAALLDALAGLSGQVLLTGTDLETFRTLSGRADALCCGGGTLRSDPEFPPPDGLPPDGPVLGGGEALH